MNNGKITIHSSNTETIGEVLVALLPKYSEVYVSMKKQYVEIQYCDSEKGARNG